MKCAKWIWKSKQYGKDEYVCFLDKFNFSSGKVNLKISVAGDYNLYINGKFVSFGQYADYLHYKVYDNIDVTEFCVLGSNEIKIIAWYQGADVFTGYDFGAGLIYEVCTENNDVLCCSKEGVACGDYTYFVSGEQKLITAQLGFNYTYDANGGEDFSFNAQEVDSMPKKLYERTNKKLTLSPIIVAEKLDEKTNIYDLKKECSGFLTIKFKAEKGRKIRISYGEHLIDGCVRSKIHTRDFSIYLIANGEWTEFTGCFRRLGCRYLEIDNAGGVDIERIGLIEPLYPLVDKPFDTNNQLRKKIYDVSVRTLRLCAHEHYEDCPWREQGMYLQDSRNQMLCGYYAFENTEMQKSAIELFMQGQREDGLYDICFPSRCEFTIPSFTLMYPWIVLEYCEYTKTKDMATKTIGSIQKAMDYFLNKIDQSGLFKTVSSSDVWHFYEWAGDLDGNFFSEDPKLKNFNRYDSLINAFISLALEKTAKIYTLLGDCEKSKSLLKIKDAINKAIFDNFFDKERKLFLNYSDSKSYSVLANALCVLAGACKDEYLSDVAKVIALGDDDVLENTLSMYTFRFDALLKVDKEKYSSIILDKIDSTYKKMLDADATSFWETEKGADDFDGAGSLCHGWSAIPVYYYNVLGVNEKA
ncbi:MAG: family 78 glycoside hydrolase catalytic domain [Clostridia bacterium]|nr:family 78 glycoside hydrolase catalytic domain [Clostridia bacterium]